MRKIAALVIIIILYACKKENLEKEVNNNHSKTESTDSSRIESMETSKEMSVEDSIKRFYNDPILKALEEKDDKKFIGYIHPEKGVQFSMYAFINDEKDKQFSKKEFEKYIHSNVKFTWGEKDGSGEKLILSLSDYLQSWVLKADFSNSNFSVNKFQGQGNSLNNLEEMYPRAVFTENYIAGTEKYGGMDWKTLRFVFEKFAGKYYLVAVINDEWTI